MRRRSLQTITIRKFTSSELLFFIFLIPFFKLLSIGLFQDAGFHKGFFSVYERFLDIMRVVMATYGFFVYLRYIFLRKNIKLSLIAKFLCCLFFMLAVVCIANRSISMTTFAKVYTYIGFILACDISLKNNSEGFFRSIIGFFGFLCVVNIVFTFLFPRGFFTATNVYDAIYFFGGKNTAFPFYFIYLYSICIRCVMKNEYLPASWFIMWGAMLLSTIISSSAAGILCVFLIFAVVILFQLVKLELKPQLIFIVLCIIVIMIYVGVNIPFVNQLLVRFGRNSTFSYRTVLWRGAMVYFKQSPLFGAGENLSFAVGNGVITDHAHSYYLDSLSKYGVASQVFFFITVFNIVRYISRFPNKRVGTYIGLLIAIYLLFMGFNDYNYNFMIVIFLMTNYALFNSKSSEKDDELVESSY